ncbi:hypothetical protein [Maricaulis sp.]|uniref:hypothetical protein n=1 Tax=Maricaulis sp. TaxID=1486257 RepID=UPI003A9420E1
MPTQVNMNEAERAEVLERVDRETEGQAFKEYRHALSELNAARTKRRNIRIFSGLGVGAGVSAIVGGEMSIDAGVLIVFAALVGVVWSFAENAKINGLASKAARLDERHRQLCQRRATDRI